MQRAARFERKTEGSRVQRDERLATILCHGATFESGLEGIEDGRTDDEVVDENKTTGRASTTGKMRRSGTSVSRGGPVGGGLGVA
ncbi:hypothetical protein PHISP_00953 [Aspergillus sp. HF37]|nr:hypothetical protein PHISP_00953 [Aspergillus sp. HF37]